MLSGELQWLMKGQVLWPGGNCVKGEWRFALDTIYYKPALFIIIRIIIITDQIA